MTDPRHDPAAGVRAQLALMCATLMSAIRSVTALPTQEPYLDAKTYRLTGDVTDDSPDEVKRLAQTWFEFDRITEEVATLVAHHLETTAALPPDPWVASVQLVERQREYDHRARVYVGELQTWQSLDVMTGRVRARVIDRLMWGDRGAPGRDESNASAPLMSATAADKAASGDPEYTRHKDCVAEAAVLKDAAHVEMGIAFERLQTARALLHTLVEVGSARRQTLVIGQSEGGGTDIAAGGRQKQH